jgi:hypothetical protein
MPGEGRHVPHGGSRFPCSMAPACRFCRIAGDYGFKPTMTWEFLSVTMTAVPYGAVGELNQNGAPPATCPGVQMNCLVIMKVQAGFCTQARTPVRSARRGGGQHGTQRHRRGVRHGLS